MKNDPQIPKDYPEISEDQFTGYVEEPIEAYVSRNASQPVLAWRILGGNNFTPNIPESAFDFFQIGEKGIKKTSLKHLAEVMGIPMVDLSDMLNVSYKTLSRKNNDDLLDGWISSHSIEIAQTLARGLALFEDKEKLKRWLRKPNRALKGKIPLELLKYPTGIRLVNQVMLRIEEGIHT
jgi:putative toxin-antitoxin system antitoxin component (TIGR02293 family)